MKKTATILMAMTVFVVLFATACGSSAAPAAPAEQAAPPVENNAPVQAADPAQPAAQSFAPACQTSTTCAAPVFADKPAYETYCVEKVPYQNILAPAGTVFEPLPKAGDPKYYPLICDDSHTVVDGLNVFTCRGAELWTYDLKITSTSCGGSTLQTGTGQCAEGQGYDAAQNCCAPLTGDASGSVTIKMNMGGCPSK